MTNGEYWLSREREWIDARNRETDKLSREVQRAFAAAADDMEKEILSWMEKYAAAEGITMADARKRLTSGELKQFRLGLEKFTELAKDNADGKWEKELTAASAAVHVSRLQALAMQMKNLIRRLYAEEGDRLADHLTALYGEERNRMAYEGQRAQGAFGPLDAVPEDRVQKLLARPWADDGQAFSARLWGTQEKLITVLQTELTRGILSGRDAGDIGTAVAKRMNAAQYAGVRLVQTETTRIITEADKDTFGEMGIEQVEIVGTLDRNTCGDLDGQVMKRTDARAGSTAPPFHPNCRCCIVPYDEELSADARRTARDPESGKTVEIPDMAYKDWKAVYVDKKKSLYSIAQPRGYRKIEITNVAIQKVPAVNLSGIDAQANEDIRECAMDILRAAKESNSSNEMMLFYNMVSREKSEIYSGTEYNVPMPQNDKILKRSYNGEVILIHNHPSGRTLSYADLGILVKNPEIGAIMAVTNAGRIRLLQKTRDFSYNKVEEIIDLIKAELGIKGEIVGEIQNQVIEEFLDRAKEAGLKYVRA